MANRSLNFLLYLTFFIIFIFPNGIVFGAFSSVHHNIFAGIAALVYLLPKIRRGRFPTKTLLIWVVAIVVSFYTGRFSFLQIITIPLVDIFIQNKEIIKKYILKSRLPYYSFVFTLFYSVINKVLGIGGRSESLTTIDSGILVGAIGEVNYTGIAVFLLGVIVRCKNKYLGNFVLATGVLTLSRSYLLALICVFLFNISFVKKIVAKIIDKLTYMNITIVSSILLFLLGIVFISLFQNNGILEYSVSEGWMRLIKLNDYSNYYRFLSIYIIVMIIINHPKTIILGFSNEEFREYGREITSSISVDFGAGIGTHNIFFSHLKMYGIAVFAEIYYLSKYLKKIVNENNFGIFMAVFMYCIILGTGLNSYWLFLTLFALILYE